MILSELSQLPVKVLCRSFSAKTAWHDGDVSPDHAAIEENACGRDRRRTVAAAKVRHCRGGHLLKPGFD
jgi:hypothetical protein